MAAEKLKKMAIIGSGAMGHGIAEMLATTGYEVTMVDVSDDLLQTRQGKNQVELGQIR